uniref:Uncharacterized protein n=1 Tax=Cacopsylla melanoneura TaxID=428564 RepID=A0A8D8M3N6_9HEMI
MTQGSTLSSQRTTAARHRHAAFSTFNLPVVQMKKNKHLALFTNSKILLWTKIPPLTSTLRLLETPYQLWNGLKMEFLWCRANDSSLLVMELRSVSTLPRHYRWTRANTHVPWRTSWEKRPLAEK